MGNPVDLSQMDMNLISYLIRRKRIEKGLTQKELSDNYVSISTISNIEKQEANVKEVKIFHVLEKLGISREQLPQAIHELEEEMENLRFHFQLIYALIENDSFDEAEKRLNELSVEDYHPLSPQYHHLKGRYYYEKKDWNKAELFFLKAIQNCEKYGIKPYENIIADCYNELSTCYYHQNDLEKAIQYVDIGLKFFDENASKKQIKHILITNKILYLMKNGNNDLASQLINEILPIINETESSKTKLNIYKFQTILLRNSNRFDEAILCCRNAIDLARRDQQVFNLLELLIVLGTIYIKLDDPFKAQTCFETVLHLDQEKKYPRRLMEAHTYLAMLYIKLKEWEHAYSHLTKGLTIGEQIKDIYRLIKTLIVFGNFYFQQNQISAAIKYYEQAMDLAKKHNYRQQLYQALFKLAECHDILEQTEQFVKINKELFYLQKESQLSLKEDEFFE